MDRRSFLALTARSSQYLLAGAFLAGCGRGTATVAAAPPSRPGRNGGGHGRRTRLADIGPLGAADENGIRLPEGFRSRVVGVSGRPPVATSDYSWHGDPDGGATFPTADGGWIYVSNSEIDRGRGGVGALRFSAAGALLDAYPILTGTSRNCAGGATPWGTWLSCEEIAEGQVWECDPEGRQAAVVRPALGRFRHEAVAVDPREGRLYLTEDEEDGRWYRFTPRSAGAPRLDLDAGTLEVARVEQGRVSWLPVDDPQARRTPTRHQVPESTPFASAEGIAYHHGVVYFSTKGDDRVWAYDVAHARLSVLYDAATAEAAILTGVDNLEVSAEGDVLVAEDAGDMQIVVLAPDGSVVPLLQVTGHFGSEITGPAFTPDGRRLYFSSQRGAFGFRTPGMTYEIIGPFA